MAASIGAGCSANAVVQSAPDAGEGAPDAGEAQSLREDSAAPAQAEAGTTDAYSYASDDREAPQDTGSADGSIPARCLGSYAAQVTGEQACSTSTPLPPPWPTTQWTVTVYIENPSGIGIVTVSDGHGWIDIKVLSTSDAGTTLLLGEGGPGLNPTQWVYAGGTLDCGSGALVFDRWMSANTGDGGEGGVPYYPCSRTSLQLTKQ